MTHAVLLPPYFAHGGGQRNRVISAIHDRLLSTPVVPRRFDFSSVEEAAAQADAVAQIEACDGPVVLIGYSFGAAVAAAITHPAEHISHEAIGYSLDWFAKTLQGGTPRSSDDQIWFRKEIGTLVALTADSSRTTAPWASAWAARICSASVVPERGMPTMKIGAGSAFVARGPLAKRSGVNVAIAASS